MQSLSPGTVTTDMTNTDNYDIDPATVEKYKHIKCLQPNDIANAVMYVLSTPPHLQVKNIHEKLCILTFLQIDELTIRAVGETY